MLPSPPPSSYPFLSPYSLTLPLLFQSLYTAYRETRLNPKHALSNPPDPSSPALLAACRTHTYTTQIVSLNPLMIYIHNFTSSAEAEALIELGKEEFQDSFISRASGGTQKVSGRTSQSAPFAVEEPLVDCSEKALTLLPDMIDRR